MIVFEEKIEALVNLLPNTSDGFKPVFYWGNSGKELNQFLNVAKAVYPLIYLTSSFERSKDNFSEAERNCTFIIATLEKNVDRLNNVRLTESYDKVLNPLAENFITLLDSSSITRIPNGYQLRRIPNYSEREQNASIDMWDVIELKCDVVISDKCLKPYQWQ